MIKSITLKNKSSRKVSYVIRAGLVLVIWVAFAMGASKGTIVLASAFSTQRGDVVSLTGNSPAGPTAKNCYSAMFHAATDCDRLASQILIPNSGTGDVKNLSQRFREADAASYAPYTSKARP